MKVSVVLPVFNAESFIRQAVKSILRQTFTDFELLIIDDGSTDNTVNSIKSFNDSRIRFIQNETNCGVAVTLNRGLALAKGKYIARMDADDISLKMRLACQVEYLDANPDVGIVGTWVRLFGDQQPLVEKTPVGSDVLAAYLAFDNPIFHPTVMLRRSLVEEYGLAYDPVFNRTEDFELWSRAVAFTRLDNIPSVLHKMRHHGLSVTSTATEVMTEQTCQLLESQLQALGLSVTSEDVKFHHRISRGKRLPRKEDVERAEKWLRLLQQQNRSAGIYRQESFDIVLGMIWFRLCRNTTPLGWWIWKKYRLFDIGRLYHPSVLEISIFFLSILFHRLKRRVLFTL